jgi:hypothetical protein
MEAEVLAFIRSHQPVSDMDLIEYFNILEDPNLVFPVFRTVRKSISNGVVCRIPTTDPVNGGRLIVREACSAIA